MEEQTIQRAYRMRVYPTAAQSAVLGRLLGATRFVWNWALERRNTAWREREERITWKVMSRDVTALRRAPETAWLSDLPRDPIIQVLRDQERAFANFFAKRAKYPRFKSRQDHRSLRFVLDQRRSQVERGEGRWALVDLPGLGALKLRRSEDLVGRLRSVTLRCDGAGRWFAALTADGVPAPAWSEAIVAAVGLDAGLRDLLVVSDGVSERRVPAPKALAGKLAKLRRYNRRQSRQMEAQKRVQGLDPAKPCPKGVRLGVSGRRRRTQQRIARLNTRIADVRRNATHEATSAIVCEAQVICIEDLSVKGMVRGMRRSFRRSVADANLGEVRRQLEYKAQWHGRTISVVDRFYPSSKTCSDCGEVNAGLQLAKKNWNCPQCGQRHDRDTNAAKNIRSEGLRLLGAVSLPATPRSGESNARGVGITVGSPAEQCRQSAPPTKNREPHHRNAKASGATARPPEHDPQALSETGRLRSA